MPDKPIGNGKRVNTRQTLDSYGSGACTRLRHYQLVPSQYRGGGPWVKGKGKAYFGVPAQTLSGEMSCWDDIPPKRDIDELESLSACYRS